MILDRAIVAPGNDITDDLTDQNVLERADAITDYINHARNHVQNLVQQIYDAMDSYPDSTAFRTGAEAIPSSAAASSSSTNNDFESPVNFGAKPSEFLRKAYILQTFNEDGSGIQNRYQHYIDTGTDFYDYCEQNRATLTVAQRLLFDASKLVSAAHNQISTLNRMESFLRRGQWEYLKLTIEMELPIRTDALVSTSENALLMHASAKQIKNMLQGTGRAFKWIRSNPTATDDAHNCALILSSFGKTIFNRHQLLLSDERFISDFALLSRDKKNLPALKNMFRRSETEELPQLFLMTRELYFVTQDNAIELAKQHNRLGLSQLLWDEDLRQTAVFLTRHGIETKDINLNSLSKSLCRTMMALERFLDAQQEEYDKHCIRNVLLGVMGYFNGQYTLMHCLEMTLPVSNQLSDDENADRLAIDLSGLLYQMLSVHQAARELNVPIDTVRYDNQTLAWLGRALHLLAYPSLAVQQELFSYVQQAGADVSQDNAVVEGTMSALRAIREQGVSEQVIRLEHLLANPLLRTHAASLTGKLQTLNQHMDRVHHVHCLLSLATTRFDIELILDGITQANTHGELCTRLLGLPPERREQARRLTDVIDMTLQLSNLGFEPEVISLFVSKQPFQQAMRGVEIKCREIGEYLATHSTDKLRAFNANIRQYRTDLYRGIHRQLTLPLNEPSQLNQDIENAERTLMTALNHDRHPWLRQSLKLISNFLSVVFTLGYANRRHEAKTGDYLFFARPESAKELKRVKQDVVHVLAAPAA